MTNPKPSYRAVRLYMEEGSVLCYQYDAPNATGGVIWLGGVRGGLDSPASGLFDRLATALVGRRVSSLRIRYRQSTDLESSVEDGLLAIQFLLQSGISRVVLVGYSMGGAVAIEVGASSPDVVKGVAVVATQSYGTGAANRLSPRPLLIVQGELDEIATVTTATYVYDRAEEPKQLFIIPGADHTFERHGEELRAALEGFVERVLLEPQSRAA